MKALESFNKLTISWADLKDHPPLHIAVLAAVSFAVSETNVFQKLFVQSAHPFSGDSDIDAAIISQEHTILRTWSSKLFELFEALSRIRTDDLASNEAEQDEGLSRLLSQAKKEIEKLKSHSGYALARNVRNEATNHYSLSAIQKNLAHVSSDADCSMYVHKMAGNSYYPIGEEVVFIGRFNRHGGSSRSKEEKLQLVDTWLDWNMSASRWATQFHFAVMQNLFEDILENKRAVTMNKWLDPSLVGDLSPGSVPVFIRRTAQ